MKRFVRFALLLLIVVSACKYNDVNEVACDVSDPANNLPWLKDQIHEIEQSPLRKYYRVEKVEYKGETGFYITNCCPFCDTFPVFYRCSGEAIPYVAGSNIVSKGVIWQPSDYTCSIM